MKWSIKKKMTQEQACPTSVPQTSFFSLACWKMWVASVSSLVHTLLGLWWWKSQALNTHCSPLAFLFCFLFYCYSVTVVCIFPPRLHLTFGFLNHDSWHTQQNEESWNREAEGRVMKLLKKDPRSYSRAVYQLSTTAKLTITKCSSLKQH